MFTFPKRKFFDEAGCVSPEPEQVFFGKTAKRIGKENFLFGNSGLPPGIKKEGFGIPDERRRKAGFLLANYALMCLNQSNTDVFTSNPIPG